MKCVLDQMQARGEEHACLEATKSHILRRLKEYLAMMKEYYAIEVQIRNIY